MEDVASLPHHGLPYSGRRDGFQKMPLTGIGLPTGLLHARNQAVMSHLPQTNTAKTKFAVITSGATAKLATITMLHLEFRCFQRFQKLGLR